MPESRRHASRRRTVTIREAAATRGGVMLGESRNTGLVRNVVTERVLPCCLESCMKNGSTRYEVKIPHEDPRWVDEQTGKQEMKIYIFCSEGHRELWVAYYRKQQNDRGPAPQ